VKLYNSKSRKIEIFKPVEDKKVKMYVCGITPYDTTHLGHAFTYVCFDVLVRYLKFKGFQVTYTQNVTDIDDDILKKAKEVGKNWKELGQYWTDRFTTDMKALNVLPPTYYVKATESLPKMIEIIKSLIQQNIAYENEGNVYFDVKKFKAYGELSKLNRNQMLQIAKDRGGNPDDKKKHDPLDFLLWQNSKEDEPSWDSPWGAGRPAGRRGSPGGRPGWHIECSAMVYQYLGDQIDIHGGGRDLIFPHHESEIAQSESYTHKIPYVKYWIHTAMLMYNGEKMSKSLGNLIMVSDLLKKYSASAIRWVLLSHHYRTPWEFNYKELDEAEQEIFQIKTTLNHLGPSSHSEPDLSGEKSNEYLKQFTNLMDNDLDTPAALSLMKILGNNILKKGKANVEDSQKVLKNLLKILGF